MPGDFPKLSGFFNARVWGFALIRAWVYLMFLGVGASLLSMANEGLPPTVYLWSSACLCLTLFAGSFAPAKMEQILFDTPARIAAIALTVVGTLLSTLAVSAWPLEAIAIAGGVFTGIGSGLIHLGYGEIYRNRPPSEVGIEVPMSVLIAGALFALMSDIPFTVQALLVSVLPVISGVIMILQQKAWAPASRRPGTQGPELILPTPRLIMRVGICACGIGLADSINRLVFTTGAGMSNYEFYHPAMVVSSVVLAVILIGFELTRKDATFRDLYKVITFIIAAAILLAPAFLDIVAFQWLGPLITLIGYNAFNAFIWILLADLCYNYRLSAAATFGMGWGMLTLGNTAGQAIGMELCNSLTFSYQMMSVMVALGTLTVFAVSMFVMKDKDLVDIEETHSMVASASKNIDEHTGDIEDTETTKGGGSSEANANKTAEAPQPKRAIFRECCTSLARECGLTPRETEILFMFAKGRTAARIQEDLVLSRGTVTTHLQHIYRKTDVHSKQELLDRIEAQREKVLED